MSDPFRSINNGECASSSESSSILGALENRENTSATCSGNCLFTAENRGNRLVLPHAKCANGRIYNILETKHSHVLICCIKLVLGYSIVLVYIFRTLPTWDVHSPLSRWDEWEVSLEDPRWVGIHLRASRTWVHSPSARWDEIFVGDPRAASVDSKR